MRCRWKGIWWNIEARSPATSSAAEQSAGPLAGDACNLKPKYGGYDLVLASNLIDRLREPARFLRDIAPRLRSGGLLVLTSPYTWLTDYTPKANWLGGIRENGEALGTYQALQRLLAEEFEERPQGRPLRHPRDRPQVPAHGGPAHRLAQTLTTRQTKSEAQASSFLSDRLPLLNLGHGLLLVVAAGQHGAHHQLDLVEDHQRQHHDPDAGGGEHDVGHGHPVGQALLGAAEDDGDLVRPVETEAATDPDVPPSTSASSTQLSSTMLARSYQPTWCQIPAPPPR
jgi:hypothetical protein